MAGKSQKDKPRHVDSSASIWQKPRFQMALLAVVVFAAALLLGPVSKPLVDSALYADLARNLAENGQFNENVQPSTQNFLFPLVLAGFMKVFGPAWIPAYLVCAALALLGAFWILAKQVIGEKNVFFASAVFVAVPIVTYVALDLLSDAPFLVFAMLSATAYLKLRQEERFSKALALTWVGFAVLAAWTRNTGFLLPVIFGLHTAAMHWIERKENEKVRNAAMAKRLAMGVILILALSAAWNARNVWSGLNDSSGHYANVLQQPAVGHLSLEIQNGRKVFELYESRTVNGTHTTLNTPLRFSVPLPLSLPDRTIVKTDMPVFLAYLIRLLAYLLIFVGPILVLTGAWRTRNALQLSSKAKARRASLSPTFVFLAAWFLVFAAFHVFWPAAFSVRYVAPLTVPLALCFGHAVGNGLHQKQAGTGENRLLGGLVSNRKLWAGLFMAQLLFSAAVISWDVKNRWAPSKAAAEGFERMGEWLQANTPKDAAIMVAGVPKNAVSFYGKRKAVLEGGQYVAYSDYLNGKTDAVEGLSKCFEHQNAYWRFSVHSKTTCP